MSRNVEIKARIEDLDALEARVIDFADGKAVDIAQDDTFFESAKGRLKLRSFSENRGELIFYQRPDQSGPKECFYLISATSEPSMLRSTLAHALGIIGRVRKHRRLYFIGRTRIHLDRVEDLGSFLELEVVLQEEESSDQGVEEANQILQQLDISHSQLIEGAYIDLLSSGQG